MAIDQEQQHQQGAWFPLEALFCEEERWDDDEGAQWITESEAEQDEGLNKIDVGTRTKPPEPSCIQLMSEQDFVWEDEEIEELLAKEEKEHNQKTNVPDLRLSRRIAVRWMLKVSNHHRFSSVTAILAIDYFDRFLSSFGCDADKPWMAQLMAVACLSLAAKMEEIKVPVLLDFQIGETKYVFDAKTIQRMELLILSSLQWKMNSATPFSFLDYLVRRLRLGRSDCSLPEILRRCQCLLQSIAPDYRYARFLPSVLAAAATIMVMEDMEEFSTVDSKNLLLRLLKINEDHLVECFEFIEDAISSDEIRLKKNHWKRKNREENRSVFPTSIQPPPRVKQKL